MTFLSIFLFMLSEQGRRAGAMGRWGGPPPSRVRIDWQPYLGVSLGGCLCAEMPRRR